MKGYIMNSFWTFLLQGLLAPNLWRCTVQRFHVSTLCKHGMVPATTSACNVSLWRILHET